MLEREIDDSGPQALWKIACFVLALVAGCGIVLAARWLGG